MFKITDYFRWLVKDKKKWFESMEESISREEIIEMFQNKEEPKNFILYGKEAHNDEMFRKIKKFEKNKKKIEEKTK
ncbi:unnamed protein product [marine sediment metagenome]|uniref:Uncharacterized protein n=1 Tax=marine sediment metagenome TaxID=412755 RepID=X1S0A9_9ZZZZ